MGTLTFLALVALFFWNKSLSDRLSALEHKGEKKTSESKSLFISDDFENSRKELDLPVAPVVFAHEAPVSPVVHGEVQKVMPPPQQTVSTPNPIMEWFSKNTLIKIGAFLFFLGAVWFVSYAITQGWISPLMRILMGVALGISVCVFGTFRKDTNTEHYLVLTTLGVGIVTASVFTGQFLFELFPSVVALVLLLCAIGYAVMVSLRTRTEWLGILSAITTLLAPLLVNVPDLEMELFLTYLLVVSLGFLVVVFVTNWRGVTLTLAAGTAIFLWAFCLGSASLSAGTAWLFVLIFSALFYGASSVSMFRNSTVVSADITTLGISAVTFVSMAYILTDSEAIVTFIAALVTATTGYVLYANHRSEKIVSVYAGLSTLLVGIATAFALDGYTLLMAYTLEVTTAFILALRVGLPQRVVLVTAYLYLIPLLLSFREMQAPEWSIGAWHGPAVSMYALILATAVSAVYVIVQSQRVQNSLYQLIGGVFTLFFWIYSCVTVSLVWYALFSGSLAYALQYMTWSVVCVLVLVFVVRSNMPASWMNLSLLSFVLPVFASLSAPFDPLWATEWIHPNAIGLYFMTALSLLIGLWFVLWGTLRQNESLRTIGGAGVGAFWLYMLSATLLFWSAICVDQNIANVLSYISWTVVSYILMNGVLHAVFPSRWLLPTFVTLGVPVIFSLGSFGAAAWAHSAIHPDALGLYSITAFLALLALALLRMKQEYQGDRELLGTCAGILWGVVGIYVVLLVWLITHAVFGSADVAVSVALFIYTVSGLGMYSVGKSKHNEAIRYTGIVLLSGVVLRLLIVDVWRMEILGRIVTFLGVGFLFILTALFEKPFEKIGKESGARENSSTTE